MTSTRSYPTIEEKIYAATRVPEPRAEFLVTLGQRLAVEEKGRPDERIDHRLGFTIRRPAWAMTAAILIILIGVFFLIGPQRVAAAFRQLLGYIPGVGVVDQSAPLRVLEEPVSQTREGITVSVNAMTLSNARTIAEYGVSGVPMSAYPKNEATMGCVEPAYLRLPDGKRLNMDAPIPAEVNEATFVMPCIFNTLEGTVPMDWELPLRFVAAPLDMTVMPVIEVAATPTITAGTLQGTQSGTAVTETGTPAAQAGVAISIEKVIENDDGYILIGRMRPQTSSTTRFEVTGNLALHDANGKNVAYTVPQDINEYEILDIGPNEKPFSIQFQAGEVAFPLTIEFQGVILSVKDPDATARVTLDTGPNPQPGQEWSLDQDVELAGHTVRLKTVSVDSRDGYSFMMEADADVWMVEVQIEGYAAAGAGGGANYQGMGMNTSVSFVELPKGNLTFVFSNLVEKSATQTWTTQWQPETARSYWPMATSAPYPVCVSAEGNGQIKDLPDGLDGQALTTQLDPDLRLALVGLDGSQGQLFDAGSSRGTVTLDGTRLAYPGNDGIVIVDLSSGEKSVLAGIRGGSLRWSPDGERIAYVVAGDVYGMFVVERNGENPRQYSNLGYESIAGWSPDGGTLYYAIPGASEAGWQLKEVDLATGEQSDLFVLEGSSLKETYATVSPDGQWIAYRGKDNGSLYVMRMDGTQSRLLIEKSVDPSAITGIVWGPDGGLLGMSVNTVDAPQGEVLLMQWEACEVYRLPGVSGELDGLVIR